MSGCATKRYYGRKALAKRAARRLRQFGNALGHAYRCRVCGGWHLTSADAATRALFRERDRAAAEGDRA